jgi:hypothetical protein
MPSGDMKTKHLSPTCYFCKKPVDEEYLCHGCGEYVCDDLECERGFGLMGPHSVQDHQKRE